MIDWLSALFTIEPDSILIYGTYSYAMVSISIFIAILASFMGFQVAVQAADAISEFRKQVMLFVGSLVLGGGIWSMHFIGMLAFEFCTQVEYGWKLTALSLVPGIGASWVALSHITQSSKQKKSLLVAGFLVGAGIGTMHYMGMAAMETAALLRYDFSMFALSIVVAVTLAVLSLWIRFGLARVTRDKFSNLHLNVIAGIVMGFAISGMHYVGMAAARFVRPPGFETSYQPPETSMYLALAISFITVVMIAIVLGANLLFKYRDISTKATENERRLTATMQTAVDGIITIDSRGIITSVNEATERLFGWSESALLGENVKMLIPDPVSGNHDGYLAHYLQSGEASIIGQGREVAALHQSGDAIAIRLAIGHVELEDDDFFVAFVTDLTQRIAMEKALKDKEEKLRSLVSNIPGIAYRCQDDDTWSMLFISDAVQSITGYHPTDFLPPNNTRHFSDIIHPDDIERVTAAVSGQPSFNIEYRIIKNDGDVRWVLEFGARISDEETGDVWLDGFIMDITERYQMVQALRQEKDKAEQAAQARATFLANMSHEIRTPMNAIIGFSDILLESELKQEQSRHLKTINHSAKSLLHLLNDILDSAKLDKGKFELEIRSFSLIEELDAVISTLWLQARNKGLELSADISDELSAQYSGAPERIRQVLTNILSNAIKFTEQGSVKLSAKPITDEHIEFVVEDTGIGMNPEQLSRIFEAFTQADASMSRRFGGTGLGTTISKQLVELMGGTISATSEEGKGSAFKVVLPLHATVETESKKGTVVTLPPLKVLIVDDISQNVDLLTLLLKRQGHQTVTARDGKQALIRMETESDIDVVLMDVQMPVMDGLSAAQVRREYERDNNLNSTPIIALTASVLEEDRLAAKEAGMEGFANKPVNIELLNHEIARVLNIEAEHTRENSSTPTQAGKSDAVVDEPTAISLWGTEDAYYGQLSKFAGTYRPEFVNLLKLTQMANTTEMKAELKALIHKLRGLSANLSLPALTSELMTLEAAVKESESEATEFKALAYSSFECFEKVEAIVASKRASIDVTEVQIEKDEIIALLQKTHDAAQENELEEDTLLVLENIAESNGCEPLRQLVELLNDFEFDKAQALISDLLNQLMNGPSN